MSPRLRWSGAAAIEVPLHTGIAHDGRWRRLVWLRPWTGKDELFMHEETQGLSPAARATALLARCLSVDGVESAGPAFARCLTVGDREAALLHLRRITLGDALACLLACPACGDKLDLQLAVGDLLLPPHPEPVEEHCAEVGQGETALSVRFRLPNGADLEDAATRAAADPEGAARAVLARCIRRVEDARGRPVVGLPPALTTELPLRMAELDPQAELLLDATCPHCGAAFQALLDAGAHVLLEISRASAHLFRQVHLLAFHYHWSEADILEMAGRRRQRYLGLLADTLGAAGVA